MPEAVAKYALNSTLGESNFMTLDKLITGQKSFISSDNILYTLFSRIKINREELSYIVPEKLRMIHPGKLKFSCLLGSSTSSFEAGIKIYKNDVLVVTKAAASYDELRLTTDDVYFEAGDVFEFELYKTVNTRDKTFADFYIYGELTGEGFIVEQ